MTCDIWHVTCDMWHMTLNMLCVTCTVRSLERPQSVQWDLWRNPKVYCETYSKTQSVQWDLWRDPQGYNKTFGKTPKWTMGPLARPLSIWWDIWPDPQVYNEIFGQTPKCTIRPSARPIHWTASSLTLSLGVSSCTLEACMYSLMSSVPLPSVSKKANIAAA